MPVDLHELPRLSDSISYLYAEHCIVEQEDSSIILLKEDGKIAVPVAATTCLMLGPGTSVTHAAIKVLSESGCLVVWCGEKGSRFYASGMGETRSAQNVLMQARLCMDENSHTEVVKRMYERRFPKLPEQDYTVKQLRGLEGIRMKQVYKSMAKMTGVQWHGRDYKTTDWESADPINHALSVANTVLYSVCHAAIVSLGYSPALGFVHTGKALSFVYDIADLYKADTTIPAAFESVKYNVIKQAFDAEIRQRCRKRFESTQLLKRIPADIAWIFNVSCEEQIQAAITGALWDDEMGGIFGGRNYADEGDAE